jgi:hypothetical protein
MEISGQFSYLGMLITICDGFITLDMSFYVRKLSVEYPYEFIDRVNPSIANIFTITESEVLNEDARKQFHTTVAKLLYICKRARPDIMTVVSFLCTQVQYATRDDKKKFEHVLGYLRVTQDDKLML